MDLVVMKMENVHAMNNMNAMKSLLNNVYSLILKHVEMKMENVFQKQLFKVMFAISMIMVMVLNIIIVMLLLIISAMKKMTLTILARKYIMNQSALHLMILVVY